MTISKNLYTIASTTYVAIEANSVEEAEQFVSEHLSLPELDKDYGDTAYVEDTFYNAYDFHTGEPLTFVTED